MQRAGAKLMGKDAMRQRARAPLRSSRLCPIDAQDVAVVAELLDEGRAGQAAANRFVVALVVSDRAGKINPPRIFDMLYPAQLDCVFPVRIPCRWREEHRVLPATADSTWVDHSRKDLPIEAMHLTKVLRNDLRWHIVDVFPAVLKDRFTYRVNET